MVPEKYIIFARTFQLKMWFFWFITAIELWFNYVLWKIVSLLIWIHLWTKLNIYRVTPDPVIWSCLGFGSLLQAFMMMWMLLSKKYVSISYR